MVSNPPASRSSYASPWLFVVFLVLLSVGAWWLLAPEAPSARPVRPAGVYVPVYDPGLGRAVARWRPDWPAGVPVPSTQAVMTRALADAVAAEQAQERPRESASLPTEDASSVEVPPALPLATLRRACVDATRRGQDPAASCNRFAAASRHTLPMTVVRAGSPPETTAATDRSRSIAPREAIGAEEEAAVRVHLDGDTCDASPRGSVAWRACRARYKQHLDTECQQRTQAMEAIGASPTPWQSLQARGYCGGRRALPAARLLTGRRRTMAHRAVNRRADDG